MASQEAICRIRIEEFALDEEQVQSGLHEKLTSAPDAHGHNDTPALEKEQIQSELHEELISAQYAHDRTGTPALEKEQIQSGLHEELISIQYAHDQNEVPALEEEPLLPSGDISSDPSEIRLKWARLISEQILNRELDDSCGIRDWDFVLKLDGSVENLADNASPSPPSTKVYPAQYQIPNEIIERLGSSQEKVQRAELFALGGLLYEVYSGREMLSDLRSGEKGENIQSCFVKGGFPENVWELPRAVRILACWCPGFAKDLLVAHSKNKSVLSKFTRYVKKHPVLFGFQVAGGIASLASFIALPVLGAVGFTAAGPVAGSAAAAWQSSMGLVEAGSIFAWCQSAAMGGAAVGGILATGIAGVTVAVGATVTGALDDVATPAPDLKKKFLTAWRRDIGEDKKMTPQL